ncbi:mannitol operon transcriptional antiterminator [Evansella vedderi]|uniref:Mannitol operon transcriptional antiterminator n=1 Tax=Evansella vedderi TaxID=38282 RepID=A0ABT9ZPB6_9BACI|nr:BglG family transcription antiterminator [Evansella vedderi]MDQ0252785.1 mannitol operon transcriptional antiterminator [Evansella vedderi]
MLDQRSTAILTQLVNATSYLPVKVLTERFNVSRRTIYNDLEKINNWLKEQGLSPVQQVRSAGLIIDNETKIIIPKKIKKLEPWHYEYSAKERKSWLAIHLLGRDTELYLDNLMDLIRVSRNTTIEDLKVLKEELVKFQLKLEFDRKSGYTIIGDERSKRKAIVYYLSLALPDQTWQSLVSAFQLLITSNKEAETTLFNVEQLKAIYAIISESEKILQIHFADDVLHSLSLRFLLFAKRISKGKIVDIEPVEKEVLIETKEYKVAQFVCEKLTNIFKVAFPEDEILYLTTHLLSAKIQYSEVALSDTSNFQDLAGIISAMVDDFQKYACVLFQNRDLLEKNLFMHIKPAFYRIKYELEIENEIAESIKEKYTEIFLLTKKIIHHLERFINKPVHDNEIAFIAMHFGGWMKREGTTPAVRRKALIVCASGLGTSQMLKQQLEGLFSTIDIVGVASIREFESKDYDVDFVISTTQVAKDDQPVFIVNPILTEAEKESLLKKVNSLFQTSQENKSIEGLMDLIKRHADIFDESSLMKELKLFLNKASVQKVTVKKPNLANLITEEMIQLVEHVPNWQEAIKLASVPLLERNWITNNYVEAMIGNIEKLGPYIVISPQFAIPHAKPEDGVNRLGMSLLRVKNAVPFSANSKHDVNIIVILAAIDSETHLKALTQLTNMLSQSTVMDKLIASNSKEEILKLVASR